MIKQSFSYRQILAKKGKGLGGPVHQSEKLLRRNDNSGSLISKSPASRTRFIRKANDQVSRTSKSPASYMSRQTTGDEEARYEEEKRKIELRKMKLLKERDQVEALKKRRSPQRPRQEMPSSPRFHSQQDAGGDDTDELQEQFLERIWLRHPKAAMLLKSQRNWLSEVSFQDLKHLLRLSEGDVRELSIQLAQEQEARTVAELALKKAKHGLQREKASNSQLEEQNDRLQELLESKDAHLSRCLSQNLRLKDAIAHAQQTLRIIIAQSKKMIRKEQIIRADKLQQVASKAAANLALLQEPSAEPDWTMLEDFLDGELEAELQDLTAKSEELILSEQQALKQLEQSPSVTGPFKQEAASASPSPSPAPAPIEDEEENLMESEIVIEETPKSTKIIQKSGFSASHAFSPLPGYEGHFASAGREDTQVLPKVDESGNYILFPPTEEQPSRNTGILPQESSIQQIGGDSAFFAGSPEVREFAAQSVVGGAELQSRIQGRLQAELSATMERREREVEAVLRESALTRETVVLTVQLERERLKKQYSKEVERLTKLNQELKRRAKEAAKQYEKQLKGLLGSTKELNESVAKLEKERQQLRAEKKELRAQLRRVENEFSVLQTQTSDVRHQFERKDELLMAGQVERDEVAEENERLRVRLREARQEFAKLSSQILADGVGAAPGSGVGANTARGVAGELLELRRRADHEETARVLEGELIAAQREAKLLKERILQLMQERSKQDAQLEALKARQAELQEELHMKEVRLHELTLGLDDERSNAENLEKKLAKRSEMLKQLQTTNQQLADTVRSVKRQAAEAQKAQAKIQAELQAVERDKTRLAITLEQTHEALQAVEHERDHAAALLDSERKQHKETGPLSTAVQQLALIVLNGQKGANMPPEERALVKELFDQNIQSLLKDCEAKLRRSQAQERLLSATLKTQLSSGAQYLGDVQSLAAQAERLGKTLQKFSAADLPVELAMMRDELVQHRADMRAKAAFAEQERRHIDREFHQLTTAENSPEMGGMGGYLGQMEMEPTGSPLDSMEATGDGVSARLQQAIAANQGNQALLSENRKLATDVEGLSKEVERLNSEQMVLMQRNVSLLSNQTEVAKLKQQNEHLQSDLSERENALSQLKTQLDSQIANNQDLKILVAKMEQQRLEERKIDRPVSPVTRGFVPAAQSQFRRETFGLESAGAVDLSKQLNEASMLQLSLQGQSVVGVNDSDNELLSLLHCQCSAMEEILQRRKAVPNKVSGASPSP